MTVADDIMHEVRRKAGRTEDELAALIFGRDNAYEAIGNAVMIARIATGEIEDITTEDGKNAAAVALGRMGGKARAKLLSSKQRSEIAKKAAISRWDRRSI